MNKVSHIAIRPSAYVTASETGTAAIDIRDFHGAAKLILDSSAVNAGTSTIKIQHSDTTTSGDFVDAPNLAFAAVGTSASRQEILFNVDRLKRYTRVVNTLAGGANTQAYSVQLIGTKQAI